MTIFCIVGPSCAGKTTCAEYIQNETSIPFIEASDSVERRRDTHAPDMPILEFAEKRLEKDGKETFARDVASLIDDHRTHHIIVSGFRTYEEVNHLRNKYSEVRLYGVYANSLLRFQRKKQRDNPDRDYSYKQFILKDFREYQFGITELLQNASEVIVNESTFDDFFEKIDDCIISKM